MLTIELKSFTNIFHDTEFDYRYVITRITPNTPTLIDNIFTNNHDNHDDVNSFIMITDIRDHFPIVISTKLNFQKNKNVNSEPIYKRSFSDGNINNLTQKLSLVKWNELLDGKDADEDYNKFIEVFMSLRMYSFQGTSVFS